MNFILMKATRRHHRRRTIDEDTLTGVNHKQRSFRCLLITRILSRHHLLSFPRDPLNNRLQCRSIFHQPPLPSHHITFYPLSIMRIVTLAAKVIKKERLSTSIRPAF